MKLHFVRHGETVENRDGIVQGWQDGSLTEDGVKQAFQVGQKAVEFMPQAIFSSDLRRAKQTTTEILKSLGNIPVYYDWRIRERTFGDLETTKSAEHMWADILDPTSGELKEGLGVEAHGIEPLDYMRIRLISFLEGLKQFEQDYQSVLVVTHGGMLNVVAAMASESYAWRKYENGHILSFNLEQLTGRPRS